MQTSLDEWWHSNHRTTPPPVPPSSPAVPESPSFVASTDGNGHTDRQEKQRDGDVQRDKEERLRDLRMQKLINFRNVAAEQTEDIRSLHEHLLHVWSQRSRAVAAISGDASERPADKE